MNGKSDPARVLPLEITTLSILEDGRYLRTRVSPRVKTRHSISSAECHILQATIFVQILFSHYKQPNIQ
jgi:hypothetical protein